MFYSYELFKKDINNADPEPEVPYTQKLFLFTDYDVPKRNTSEFDKVVKKFRDDVIHARYLQRGKVAATRTLVDKQREEDVLRILDAIDVCPRTEKDLQRMKEIFNNGNPVSQIEYEKIIGTGYEKRIEHKKYKRDMNLAFFGPPFLLAFLPVILFVLCLLTCARTGCSGCWFCDFCMSEFMFFWLFSIIFTGPIALLIMISCTNAVHKKYGEEPDKLTNAVLLASAIRCAFSNVKALKKSTRNLLDQNGKTEV